jgi:hypothetical protein
MFGPDHEDDRVAGAKLLAIQIETVAPARVAEEPAESVCRHAIRLDQQFRRRRRELQQRASRRVSPRRLRRLGRVDVQQAQRRQPLQRR